MQVANTYPRVPNDIARRQSSQFVMRPVRDDSRRHADIAPIAVISPVKLPRATARALSSVAFAVLQDTRAS